VTALPESVAEAFDGARTFALETYRSEFDVAEFFAAAQFDDGRRLTDFFDPASVASIRAALGAASPTDDVLLQWKPWAVLLKLGERPGAGGGETLDGRLLAETGRHSSRTGCSCRCVPGAYSSRSGRSTFMATADCSRC
jgi:hypothetical protein